jgi:aromatic ring-cleaving dioxygenase
MFNDLHGSVLIHPNTDDTYKDHTELEIWMGRPWPLNVEILKTGMPKF